MPRRIELTHVKVGDEPVGFTTPAGTLHLAGKDYTLEEWQELERRINLLYQRAGLLKSERERAKSADTISSNFLSQNWRLIASLRRGRIVRPPFFLRPFFPWVINREGE